MPETNQQMGTVYPSCRGYDFNGTKTGLPMSSNMANKRTNCNNKQNFQVKRNVNRISPYAAVLNRSNLPSQKANKTTSGPFQNPQNNKYNQYYNQNGTNFNSNFNNSSIKPSIIRTSVGSQLSNNCNGANSSNHFE